MQWQTQDLNPVVFSAKVHILKYYVMFLMKVLIGFLNNKVLES